MLLTMTTLLFVSLVWPHRTEHSALPNILFRVTMLGSRAPLCCSSLDLPSHDPPTAAALRFAQLPVKKSTGWGGSQTQKIIGSDPFFV